MSSVFKRLNEYFAFTKNEQKVFLFLSVVLLSGVAIKIYKTYVVPPEAPRFDYAQSDSVFLERSRSIIDDSASVAGMAVIRTINLNTATKTDLMTLPGIGETTAERILLHREERGKFKTPADLKNVKGIGDKKFEKLKPYIEVQ
jgi:competence protein ComEA